MHSLSYSSLNLSQQNSLVTVPCSLHRMNKTWSIYKQNYKFFFDKKVENSPQIKLLHIWLLRFRCSINFLKWGLGSSIGSVKFELFSSNVTKLLIGISLRQNPFKSKRTETRISMSSRHEKERYLTSKVIAMGEKPGKICDFSIRHVKWFHKR